MTIGEIMLFRIFILFLSVVITQSEFRTGLWRRQDNEDRNNLSGYRRDNQPGDSYGTPQIYFPDSFENPKPISDHKRQENNLEGSIYKGEENNFGGSNSGQQGNNSWDSNYKRQDNNFEDSDYKRKDFGYSTYKREEKNFGDSTPKREENYLGNLSPEQQKNNFGDSAYKRQENDFVDSTYKREENNFGDSTPKREENYLGNLSPEQQKNNYGDSAYKREEIVFGDSNYKQNVNNSGNPTPGQQMGSNSTNKQLENNFGGSTPKREENYLGNSTPEQQENTSGGSTNNGKQNTQEYNEIQSTNNTGGSTPGEKCGLHVPRRIIGGTKTDIDEFPWLCLLEYVDPSGNVSYDCSGVLISKRYVLTAAHCTNGPGLKSREMKVRRVRLGEWDLSSEKDCQGGVCSAQLQEIDVETIIPHENYKPGDKSQVNDIALVRLSREANLNQFVQPVCLPSKKVGGMNYEGKKLTVSGWGRTSNVTIMLLARDSSSNVKMKVDLPVVNRDRCRQFYQSFYGNFRIAESQFCAGGEEGKDTCQGDSGSPLMAIERTNNEINWYVIGIVSSGPAACGVQDRPSLYTNVSQYTNWITDNIKN